MRTTLQNCPYFRVIAHLNWFDVPQLTWKQTTSAIFLHFTIDKLGISTKPVSDYSNHVVFKWEKGSAPRKPPFNRLSTGFFAEECVGGLIMKVSFWRWSGACEQAELMGSKASKAAGGEEQHLWQITSRAAANTLHKPQAPNGAIKGRAEGSDSGPETQWTDGCLSRAATSHSSLPPCQCVRACVCYVHDVFDLPLVLDFKCIKQPQPFFGLCRVPLFQLNKNK